LTSSDYDKYILEKMFNVENTFCIPTSVEDQDYFAAREKLVNLELTKNYTGNLIFNGDFHNRDRDDSFESLKFTLQKIWPEVLKKTPESYLDVCGLGIDKSILELCNKYPRVRAVVMVV